MDEQQTVEISPWLSQFLFKMNLEAGGDGDVNNPQVLSEIPPERMLIALEAAIRFAMMNVIENNDKLHEALNNIVAAHVRLEEACDRDNDTVMMEKYAKQRQEAINAAKPLVLYTSA